MLGMARTDWRCKVGGKTIQYLLRMFRNFFPAVTKSALDVLRAKSSCLACPLTEQRNNPPPTSAGNLVRGAQEAATTPTPLPNPSA